MELATHEQADKHIKTSLKSLISRLMLLLLARKTRSLRCLHAVTVKEHECLQASPIFVLLSCQIIFLSFWLTFFP